MGRVRSYGGRVGDLDFVPRGRPQAGEPVEPPAAAKRHSLSHQLIPDSKGLRLLHFLQAAAGGTHGGVVSAHTGHGGRERDTPARGGEQEEDGQEEAHAAAAA